MKLQILYIKNKLPAPQFQPMLDTNNTNTTAQVLKVAVTGEPNNYTFAVTIS